MTQEELALKVRQLRIAIQGLRVDALDGCVASHEDVEAVEDLAWEVERALRPEAAAVKAA
jgi:hypothetical protein